MAGKWNDDVRATSPRPCAHNGNANPHTDNAEKKHTRKVRDTARPFIKNLQKLTIMDKAAPHKRHRAAAASFPADYGACSTRHCHRQFALAGDEQLAKAPLGLARLTAELATILAWLVHDAREHHHDRDAEHRLPVGGGATTERHQSGASRHVEGLC